MSTPTQPTRITSAENEALQTLSDRIVRHLFALREYEEHCLNTGEAIGIVGLLAADAEAIHQLAETALSTLVYSEEEAA